MSESRVKLRKRHPGQQRLASGAKRYNAASMGRRWGKTSFGIDILIDDEKRGCLYGNPVAWFAPTYKLLDDAFREMRQALGEVGRPNLQQRRIDVVGGGCVDFWTLDTPDAGRGRKYARAVIDEAAMARHLEEAWTAAIRPTLTDLHGDAWFFSTPKGMNFFAQLYERAGGLEDWARFTAPTHDNPYIDPAEIDAARADVPELVFRQEYLAEFVSFEGTAVKREWIQRGDPPDCDTITMGVDLAISTKETADYTACVVLGKTPSGELWVLDAARTRAPFHQVLEFVRAVASRWSPKVIAIEQVQYQASVIQELMRTTTLPIKGVRPDKDKLARFMPLQARYEQGLVHHADTLPQSFEGELLAFPIGDHDDMVDALAYAYAETAEPEYIPPIPSAFGGAERASPWRV